jgi:hypothetical protein
MNRESLEYLLQVGIAVHHFAYKVQETDDFLDTSLFRDKPYILKVNIT